MLASSLMSGSISVDTSPGPLLPYSKTGLCWSSPGLLILPSLLTSRARLLLRFWFIRMEDPITTAVQSSVVLCLDKFDSWSILQCICRMTSNSYKKIFLVGLQACRNALIVSIAASSDILLIKVHPFGLKHSADNCTPAMILLKSLLFCQYSIVAFHIQVESPFNDINQDIIDLWTASTGFKLDPTTQWLQISHGLQLDCKVSRSSICLKSKLQGIHLDEDLQTEHIIQDIRDLTLEFPGVWVYSWE